MCYFDTMISYLWIILNSNFFTALFGAFFGSLTIFIINYFNKQKKLLADINTSLAVLSSLQNAYLMIKRTHSLPVYNQYSENLEKFKKLHENRTQITGDGFKVTFNQYLCPPLDFDLPTVNLFSQSEKCAFLVPYIIRAKGSAYEVKEALNKWNSMTKELYVLNQVDKVKRYLGLYIQEGMANTTTPDTILNLHNTVEDALFFTNLAAKAVRKMAKLSLSRRLFKRVVSLNITDEESKKLMPNSNHKEGWGDDLS